MADLVEATGNATTNDVSEDKMEIDLEDDDDDNDNDDDSSEAEEDDNEEDNDKEEEEDGELIESLVAGRQKRSTAGSKYQQLLNATLRDDAEDEVSLLFAEQGEDEEFDETKVEEPADEEDDSSSDEEDQAGGQDDELAGEKELEKQERAAKRSQKRKAEQALAKAAPLRKKVKIETPAESSRTVSETPSLKKPTERTRKRSERVSWLPAEADAPVRTSSRTLSVQNKERTIESMKESEARRIRQMEIIENAQKRKEAVKVQPMTQAERMAEAIRIAHINRSSLNTWEEAEAERAARQKARLDALHNRTLEGPFIRWYSGPAEWTDGKLTYYGRRPKIEEVVEVVEDEKDKITPRNEHKQMTQPEAGDDSFAGKSEQHSSALQTHQQLAENGNEEVVMQQAVEISPAVPQPIPSTEPERSSEVLSKVTDALSSAEPISMLDKASQATGTQRIDANGDFLDGLEYYASLNEDNSGLAQDNPKPEQDNIGAGHSPREHSLPVRASETTELEGITKPNDTVEAGNQDGINNLKEADTKPTFVIHDDFTLLPQTSQIPNPNTTSSQYENTTVSTSHPPPNPPEISLSSRQTLTLLNYPTNTPLTNRDILRRILFAWPSASHLPNTTSSLFTTYASISTAGTAPTTTSTGAPKRAKKEEISAFTALKPVPAVCVISGQEARYQDPLTGLPYRGIGEFKSLRGMARQGQGQGSGVMPPPPPGTAEGQDTIAAPIWSSLLGAYVGAGGRRGNLRPPPPPLSTGAATVLSGVQRESVEAIKWRAAAKVPEAFVGGGVVAPVLPATTTNSVSANAGIRSVTNTTPASGVVAGSAMDGGNVSTPSSTTAMSVAESQVSAVKS